MRVQISGHQDKAKALISALVFGGHEITNYDPEILLIDWDGNIAHYPRTIERAYENGADVYLYSHGAFPLTCWDGIIKPSSRVSVYLAQTEGEKGVMERYNYPNPIHVIGWHYCKQERFLPVERPKNILFAPWHPQGTGWLNPLCKEANADVMQTLLGMGSVNLTVRYLVSLEANGLEEIEDVTYELSDKTIAGSIESIKRADLVVANPGTFACLAIALGVPVVMYGQDIKPHDGYSDATLRYVRNWDKYKDYMRYPYDISGLAEGGAWFVMMKAAQKEASDWRSKFIGNPFDPGAFVALLEKLHDERLLREDDF